MDRIEITNPFFCLARCVVEYDGRAGSTLQEGVYLLIRKQDGAFLVHGSQNVPALNYQPAGSRTYIVGHTLLVQGKRESLKITVQNILHSYRPQRWSHNPIAITRTEKELQQKLAGNLNEYIPEIEFVSIIMEYPTEHGPVDLVAVDTRAVHHVIEIKRKLVTVAAAVQLRKYLDTFQLETRGYVAGPAIASNAMRYCERAGYKFLEVQHDRPSI